MGKFHVNPESGNPGECKAEVQCPFGGDEAHYTSADNARKAFELSMAGETFAVAKPNPATIPWEERSLEDRTSLTRHNVESFMKGKGLIDHDIDLYMAMPARDTMHRKFRPVYDAAIEDLDLTTRSIDWTKEEDVEHFSRSMFAKAHEYKELAKTTSDKKGYYHDALARSFEFLGRSVPLKIYFKALKDPVYEESA